MELSDEFEVSSAIDETWAVLTDIERIAPCMPGAELREVAGEEFRGVVKVKLGAITAEYRGVARFLQKDDAAHVAVLRAEGREARGQGNASATITARLEPTDNGTRVRVDTDLQITGKVAQFGRGLLADISTTLIGQFVDNLESTVLHGGGADRKGGDSGGSSVTGDSPGEHARPVPVGEAERRVSSVGEPRAAEPVDVIALARRAFARRAVPAIGSAAAFVALIAVVRRALASRKSDG